MSTPRLVEVETIDCVIEQLVYVRDRYEEENDELRMELSAIKKQRDELLATLEEVKALANASFTRVPYRGSFSSYKLKAIDALCGQALATTKAQGGEE